MSPSFSDCNTIESTMSFTKIPMYGLIPLRKENQKDDYYLVKCNDLTYFYYSFVHYKHLFEASEDYSKAFNIQILFLPSITRHQFMYVQIGTLISRVSFQKTFRYLSSLSPSEKAQHNFTAFNYQKYWVWVSIINQYSTTV